MVLKGKGCRVRQAQGLFPSSWVGTLLFLTTPMFFHQFNGIVSMPSSYLLVILKNQTFNIHQALNKMVDIISNATREVLQWVRRRYVRVLEIISKTV